MLKGIDVSKWQGHIDWKKVKADGIRFAMIRVGFATTLDERFHYNATEALRNGIDIGIYLYSYALNAKQAKAEAQFVIKHIKDYEISYPVAYDLEDKSQVDLGSKIWGEMIHAFNGEIKKAGYIPGIYTNLNWLRHKLNYNDVKPYDLWLAQWTSKPTYEKPFTLWQSTDSGKVSGIKTNVDLNVSYKDYGKEYRDMKEKIQQQEKKIKELEAIISKGKVRLDSIQKICIKLESLYKEAKKNLNNPSRLSAIAKELEAEGAKARKVFTS